MISSGPRIVLDSSLAMHLDAGNPDSYSGSGSTWYDLSGNRLNCTLYNTTYSANNVGYLVFNGSTAYGEVADNILLRNSSFTASIWAYGTSAGASPSSHVFGKHDSTSSTNGWALVQNSSGTTGYYIKAGATEYDPPNSSGALSRWYNTVLTCNNSSAVTSYMNGVSLGSTAFTGTTNTSTAVFRIAKSVDTFWPWWGGYVSQIQIYNRVLTASEVNQNFVALRGRYGLG